MNGKNDRSPHILNTSATLLGLCFIVLTSRKIIELKEATFIDELTACAVLLFMTSCVLSFLAMRSKNIEEKMENFADVIFLIGLFFLFVTTVLITLNIIT